MFEFGRSIVGNAGVLLTRVEYLKRNTGHRFAIVDAAMNDLMRPALYDAYHAVLPVRLRSGEPEQVYDIVGPVCESGDWLARGRRLGARRGRPAGDRVGGSLRHGDGLELQHQAARRRSARRRWPGAPLVREREPLESLFALERRLPG